MEEARSAGVMAGSVAESMALSAQLGEPGQLVALLSARRRKVLAGHMDTGVERFKNGPNAAPAATRAADREVPGQPSGGGFRLGHVALLIGAAAGILLVLAGLRGPRFVVLAWVLSLVGAAGVSATGPSLGLRGAARVVATAVAAMPALGWLVNVWLLVRWAGRRSA